LLKTPLTKTQLQLMSITAEECGELTQVCMKAVRFGLDEKQRQRLLEELGDVQCMINLMIDHNVVTEDELADSAIVKYNKLKKWSNLIE